MSPKRSPGRVLVAVAGGAMVIDTLLAWQSIDVGSLTFTRNAWHGLWGLLVGVLSILYFLNALVLGGIVSLNVRLPHRLIALCLGPAVLISALAKNIDDKYSGWASYVGILVAGAMSYGAWLVWNEQPEVANTPAGAGDPDAPADAPDPPAAASEEAPG